MLPHPPALVLQCSYHPVQHPDTQGRRRFDRLVPYFHDRVIEQADERISGPLASDFRQSRPRMCTDGPIFVLTGTDQSIQALGIGHRPERLGSFLTSGIVDVLECFQ
jgi:hypothetical protein